MKRLNILITGIGGDIGQGCGRILKNHEIAGKIVGCDIHKEHAGFTLFDSCEIVPKAIDSEYLSVLYQLVVKHSIDAIIPTSEPELRVISTINDRSLLDGLPLVMPNLTAMQIGFDKLETSRFLQRSNIDSPWTVGVEESDPLSFPCILKSRFGSGNSSIYVLKTPNEIDSYRRVFRQYIFQEYLSRDDEEYTCGIYRSKQGLVRSISLRRRLASGVTSFAETASIPEVTQLCENIAHALRLQGSINIQLRLTQSGPRIFEINPRFSSTVVFRHKLGFQDLVWSIQEQILNVELGRYESPNPRIRMYRTFNELIESDF